MTQDVRTRPVDRDDTALDDLGGGITISLSDVLDRIWRLFISKVTGLVLILSAGLLSLIGTLLTQVPSEVRGDAQAYANWVKMIKPRYGGWTTVLDKLGMFHVFSSIWFQGVMTLLTMSILACSINRAPKLWRRAVHPRLHRTDTFFAHAPLRASFDVPGRPEDTVAAVRRALRRHGWRTVADPNGTGLYADKFRWGPFGTVAAHLSFVVILLGVVLTASTGFKNTGFAAPVDSKVPVGHGTGLVVEARSFSDAYYLDGSPKDYASDLVLYRDGRQVARKTVRVNQPLRYGGVSFYQSFYGTAAAMKATDGSGRTLYADSVPLQWSSGDGKHVIGQFNLPAQNLSVYVVGAASGEVDPNIGAGQMQLEIYRTGQQTPIATEVVSQGKPLNVSGVNFTFQRERQFTGLIVAHDPGATWVWVGAVLMVLGLFSVFFFPHRRMWVRVTGGAAGSTVACASPMRRDSAFESRFTGMVADIRQAATGDRQHEKVGPDNA